LQKFSETIKVIDFYGVVIDADHWTSGLPAPAVIRRDRSATEIDYQIPVIRSARLAQSFVWMEQKHLHAWAFPVDGRPKIRRT
jgi:hypothetical protein